jgi:hypothetical protein
LRRLLPTDGSMKLPLAWRRKVTPSGRRYCQLALLGDSTDETGCGLWATPNTMDGMGDRSVEAMQGMYDNPKARKGRSAPSNLREQVNPAMWPTPKASSSGPDYARENRVGTGECLPTMVAKIALWPTPDTSDRRGKNSSQIGVSNIAKGLWLTPRANEAVEPSGQAAKRLGDRKLETACSLGEQAKIAQAALWTTPSARDWKDSQGMSKVAGGGRSRMDQLPRQIPVAHAERIRGCSGDSEREDAENADTSGQGSEIEWVECPDGKARPVKPGICLLAHGLPERIHLLRAAGNAIYPPVAAKFIEASEAVV